MRKTGKWLAVVCMAALAALLTFAGAGTVQADTHIISGVSLTCDMDQLPFAPGNTEGAVKNKLWSALGADSEGIGVDISASTLMYWNETAGECYGIGDGSRPLGEGNRYYIHYVLEAKDGYDWPDVVKGFQTNDDIPVAEVPEIRVYYNGARCTDAFLAFNSHWNNLLVRVPLFLDVSSSAVTLNTSSFVYDGSAKMPAVKSVKRKDGSVLKTSNYTLRYLNASNQEVSPVNAGTYYASVLGTGMYGGEAKASFTIRSASMAGANITGVSSVNYYTGKPITHRLVVWSGSLVLKPGVDYTVSYKNNTDVGRATVAVTGKGNFVGTRTVTFEIIKAANPLTVSAKTVTVKYAKLKKKTQTIKRAKALKVSGAAGKLRYQLKSVKKKAYKKYFSVNKKSGKITVKRGLKKGTYQVKIKVSAAGNKNYQSGAKTATVKVKVK